MTSHFDSDEGTGHEEKASDEMAMELFSSIAKVLLFSSLFFLFNDVQAHKTKQMNNDKMIMQMYIARYQ